MDKPSSDSPAKHKGSIRRIGAKAFNHHSSVFIATFAMGAVKSVVMADQGSDGNIMPPALFAALKEAVPDLQVEHLDPRIPSTFWTKPVGSCAKRDRSWTYSFAYVTVISCFCGTFDGI